MRRKPLFLTLALLLMTPNANAGEDKEDFIAQLIGATIKEQEARENEEQRDFEQYEDAVENIINKQLKVISRHHATAPNWFKADQYDLPVVYNDQVAAVINYFSGNGKGFFAKWLRRSAEIKPIVLPILQKYGVPEDLFFLSMIESGLSMKAYSHVGAAGPWQFMPGTGRDYRLRVDSAVDQRMDLIKSTEAAARYLRNLYKYFGDWNLAMASYNWGQGSVSKAIKRCGSDNYWELVNSSCMPEETRQYVPKVYAAAIIYKNAERFGFEKPKTVTVEAVTPVTVPYGLTFSQISAATGVDIAKISQYNYALLNHQTPKSGAFTFYVSASLAPKITRQQQKLLALAQKNQRTQAQVAVVSTDKSPKVHKVQKGETLTMIAKKYNCQLAQIRKLNGLKNDNIKIGTSLKIPGAMQSGKNNSAATEITQKQTVVRNSTKPAVNSQTKNGSSVTISSKSSPQKATAQIVARSNVKNNVKDTGGTKKSNTGTQKTGKTIKVQSGDSLWKIAKRYGLSIEQLLSLNPSIDAKKALKAGTVLRISGR